MQSPKGSEGVGHASFGENMFQALETKEQKPWAGSMFSLFEKQGNEHVWSRMSKKK